MSVRFQKKFAMSFVLRGAGCGCQFEALRHGHRTHHGHPTVPGMEASATNATHARMNAKSSSPSAKNQPRVTRMFLLRGVMLMLQP